MNELQWIADIVPGLQLEANTVYEFNPPLNLKEMYKLREQVEDKDVRVKDWFRIIMKVCHTGEERYKSVKYFCIKEHQEQLFVKSWCTTSNPRQVYHISTYKIINGRELWMNSNG